MDTYGHKGRKGGQLQPRRMCPKMRKYYRRKWTHMDTKGGDRKKRKRERESIGPSSDRAKRGEMNVTG